jgi:hypothetical protein
MDLRRRRREAVVIHDGDVDRPIGQEDVYMRDEDGDLERRFQALEGVGGPLVAGVEGRDDLERRSRELGEIDMGGTSVLVEDESDEEDVHMTAA